MTIFFSLFTYSDASVFILITKIDIFVGTNGLCIGVFSGERRVIAVDGDSADPHEDRPNRVDVFGATASQLAEELSQEQNVWSTRHCLRTVKDNPSTMV